MPDYNPQKEYEEFGIENDVPAGIFENEGHPDEFENTFKTIKR